jgi:hypothetical protein
MAWINLANNQMVSFTDAQTSGIALKAGQSHVTSNECMTKTQIQAKYNVLTAPMDSFASNQLVEKEKWASALSGNTLYVRGVSSSERQINNTLIRPDGSQTGVSVLGGLCENKIFENPSVIINTPTQNVRITIFGGSSTESFFWVYQVWIIYPTYTDLIFTNQGSVTVGSTSVNIDMTITGLTSGSEYLFEATVQSDICPT